MNKIDYEKESEIFKALGHPIRLQMVEGLMNNECNVNKIMTVLDLPQSTVSQHLGILKTRGIIKARKEGVKTCYRVVDGRVKEIMKVFNKK